MRRYLWAVMYGGVPKRIIPAIYVVHTFHCLPFRRRRQILSRTIKILGASPARCVRRYHISRVPQQERPEFVILEMEIRGLTHRYGATLEPSIPFGFRSGVFSLRRLFQSPCAKRPRTSTRLSRAQEPRRERNFEKGTRGPR